MQDEVERGSFSGVALISRGGRVIFEKAYGPVADVELERPEHHDNRSSASAPSRSPSPPCW